MGDLPGGIYTVVAVCGIALSLVIVFALKESRFSYCFRRGIKLCGERNYQAALWYLIRAERIWMLRLSKQTMASRAEDCRNLGKVLDLIAEASGYCSLSIDTKEYRKTVKQMEVFFSTEKSSSIDYPTTYSTFLKLRKQFWLESKNLQA